ncbi:MAG TPA: amidase [Rhizorhapis sp.]
MAAGLCHGAIGTDTGGSIRMPAAVNGLSGIMPTWGRVSRHGVFPLVESLDHVGPMARSLADAAAILQVIAGADTADPTSQCSPDAVFGEGQDKIEGRVIGYDPRLLEEDVDPLLADAVRQTMEIFRSAGLIVREARFPRLDRVGMETFGMMAEMAVAHEERFRDYSDRYGARLRSTVKAAAQVPGKDVARAYLARDRFAGEVNTAFRSIDMLLTPALPEPAPLWTDYDAVLDDMAAIGRRFTRFLSPFNIAHVPAIVFPIGQDGNGVPIAAQLVAAPWQEALLCHTGMAFQAATTHHLCHPTL